MQPPQVEIQRITIEQEGDWLRVQGNADAALNEALEARLATLPGGSQGDTAKRLRPALEERVNALRARMWELAKPNLRVNGFNYEDFVEKLLTHVLTTATEPFDEALDRQIWSLNTERISWETKVRERRRHMPDQVFDLLYNIEERRSAATWQPSAADRQAEVSQGDVSAADVPVPPRHEEVVETFSTVVGNLSDLVKVAPQQLERAKRVHVVQDELARLPA